MIIVGNQAHTCLPSWRSEMAQQVWPRFSRISLHCDFNPRQYHAVRHRVLPRPRLSQIRVVAESGGRGIAPYLIMRSASAQPITTPGYTQSRRQGLCIASKQVIQMSSFAVSSLSTRPACTVQRPAARSSVIMCAARQQVMHWPQAPCKNPRHCQENGRDTCTNV